MILQYQTEIDTALKEANHHFIFSGYQLVTSHKAEIFSLAGGVKSYWDTDVVSDSASQPGPFSSALNSVSQDTYFDLGSLTKVILATSVFARLWERRELSLDEPLSTYLPSFKKTSYANIKLSQLLSHSSGLIAWHPFYQESKKNLIEIFIEREKEFLPLASSSQTPPFMTYSDLGFLLLGEVLKAHWGGIAEIFEREVVGPLGLTNLRFGPLNAQDTAATEYCLERRRLAHGEVFDLNTAWLGGCSVHAGLFSSARNLLPWACEWLKAVQGISSWLKLETAVKFTSLSNGAINKTSSTWALGWDTKSAAYSSAGNLVSMQSFGHLGFPGTSVWIDPVNEGIAILLTNRVHPSRFDERIKKFRPLIHELVAKAWGCR